MLTCRPFATEDGRFQARVVISALGGLKTQAQRFIDLEIFDSHDEAVAAARDAGMQWIDKDVPFIEAARKPWNLQDIAGTGASLRTPVVVPVKDSRPLDYPNRRRNPSEYLPSRSNESLHAAAASADKRSTTSHIDLPIQLPVHSPIRSKRP
jgi:hypothetical protein